MSILIDNSYNSVINRLTKKPVLISSREIKQIEKPVNIDIHETIINDIKKIIMDNKVNNIAPSTKKILELTEFKHHEVIAAKKKLVEDGYLKVVGNTTYINNLEVVG